MVLFTFFEPLKLSGPQKCNLTYLDSQSYMLQGGNKMNSYQSHGWMFSDLVGKMMELTHPELYLWIWEDRNGHRTIVIRDFDKQLVYCINYDPDEEIYQGEVRPVKVFDDAFEDADSSEALYMDFAQKTEMQKLMRRAISFRTNKMPVRFLVLWFEVWDTLHDLDIVNPGQKRYKES